MSVIERASAPGGSSWIRDMLILTRLRAKWSLWLAFTTSLKPHEEERTRLTRQLDKIMCDSINGAQR